MEPKVVEIEAYIFPKWVTGSDGEQSPLVVSWRKLFSLLRCQLLASPSAMTSRSCSTTSHTYGWCRWWQEQCKPWPSSFSVCLFLFCSLTLILMLKYPWNSLQALNLSIPGNYTQSHDFIYCILFQSHVSSLNLYSDIYIHNIFTLYREL